MLLGELVLGAPELGTACGPVDGALDEGLGETVEPPLEEPEEPEPVEPEEDEPELPEDMLPVEPELEPMLPDEPELLFIPMPLHAARTNAHATGIVHFNIRFS
ncbi:hypothetical protein [Noviherbaspirillum massiliense]|uniref:hypothetical protein n=1 Tax=Noviherbaspirillum massiliense TaxID=1465823 RepID=UPI00031C0576|nr:hypothetical protein [Noviherbaspirillum massiliense]